MGGWGLHILHCPKAKNSTSGAGVLEAVRGRWSTDDCKEPFAGVARWLACRKGGLRKDGGILAHRHGISGLNFTFVVRVWAKIASVGSIASNIPSSDLAFDRHVWKSIIKVWIDFHDPLSNQMRCQNPKHMVPRLSASLNHRNMILVLDKGPRYLTSIIKFVSSDNRLWRNILIVSKLPINFVNPPARVGGCLPLHFIGNFHANHLPKFRLR